MSSLESQTKRNPTDSVEANGTTIAVGDWVTDKHPSNEGKAIVVECHDIPAADWFILNLQCRVSEVPSNEQYPSDDPVVRVVFTDSLSEEFDDWTVEEILDYDVRVPNKLGDTAVRAYTFPISRLKPLDV